MFSIAGFFGLAAGFGFAFGFAAGLAAGFAAGAGFFTKSGSHSAIARAHAHARAQCSDDVPLRICQVPLVLELSRRYAGKQ
jgi:hypothetical protein